MKQWLPSFSFLYQKRPRTRRRSINLSPPVILASGFLGLIVLGTLLLKLPFATEQPITWLESLFTATSAVTVTGLVVVDTGATFSGFGLSVITLLIQAGGLGFMTFAVVAAISLGGQVGLKQQMLAKEVMQQTSLGSIKKTAFAVVTLALVAEAIAIVVMTVYWTAEKGFVNALLESVFYAVSAFNSAGFVLTPNGLVDYQAERTITLLISVLFVIGGLGFSVINNIYEKRRWNRFSVYSKAILIATLLINAVAMAILWLLESGNPATIGNMPWYDQAVNAWFQAVTPRSAGFNTVDTGAMTEASAVFTLLLMFIGGGSMSTAGGIKLGTFIILLLATYTFLRRREAVTLGDRTIPQDLVMKALAVTIVYLGLIFAGIFALMILNSLPFIDIAFEVLSASATVGLSRGITAEVTDSSQLILIFLMFAGRLGPLTLGYFVATPKKRHVRYPDTDIQVG
ncbi:Ktr system potassium transporter B [Idiomarina sp. OT37-5b]|jgi:trk system potassium uptake protein TrkH|uniref:Ktr system potassium transporter B n=1 Tax=Idiomarina aquatica TaxID=1327752 RepID=A0AA94JF24_9GAMM|nr:MULTISPECIES: potassium transporter TrkG [Idiomarina]AVJ54942.1 Ktr system potassium transporter B [Idiomarina sp. OT37-5b]RUO45526.1 Ktr system potassium transporter B [Idiomarina aquatica]